MFLFEIKVIDYRNCLCIPLFVCNNVLRTVTDDIQAEFKEGGIPLTKDTVFQIISGDDGKKMQQKQPPQYFEVGGEETIIGFTRVYNKIEDYPSNPAGTVGWRKWVDKKFKELKLFFNTPPGILSPVLTN